MKLPTDHQTVEVESFENTTPERGGKVLLRPIKGQKFPVSMLLEGNKSLVQDYPVGTRFRVQVSPMARPGGKPYLFSSWQWDAQVLSQPDDAT